MNRRQALAAIIAATAVPRTARAEPADADGPYVWTTPGGWTARSLVDGRLVETTVGPRGVIEIGAVGPLPAFEVTLRPPAGRAPFDLNVGKAPIFVMADSHGEFDIVIEFLRAQKIVDDALNWRFGRGQFVVTGDIFDRGARQLELLWFFYRLEAQARLAGGALHLLLGNHELLTLDGDHRYLHPRHGGIVGALGLTRYAELFRVDTVIGQWLRSKPAVLRLNDMLFTHGGISPAVTKSGLTLAALNDAVNTHLAGRPLTPAVRDLVLKAQGPLWQRGYFGAPDKADTDAQVSEALVRFRVSRMFVGHTVTPKVTALYGGKVIAVQVYPKRDLSTGRATMEGAVVTPDGAVLRAKIDGSREPLVAAAR